MASGQASHQAYDTFSEPGFRGRYNVIEWVGDRAHVLITDLDCDALSMEVVWERIPGRDEVLEEEGSFIVMEKDFSRRTCIVRIEQHPRIAVAWLLDVAPTSIVPP